MQEQARRGFLPGDTAEFSRESLRLLRRAQGDVACLLNRGYEIGRCVTFVGDRYQLSARQRMALLRSTTADAALRNRKQKRKDDFAGETLRIDGFNLIIPLEIALCRGTLLLCMDGAVRDLAGLHGTYRPIPETDGAVRMIGAVLERYGAAAAEFYFDAPVSNAGRLAHQVRETLRDFPFRVAVRTEDHIDGLLSDQDNVVTGDSVILNRCGSWINLSRIILRECLPEYPFVDLSLPEDGPAPFDGTGKMI